MGDRSDRRLVRHRTPRVEEPRGAVKEARITMRVSGSPGSSCEPDEARGSPQREAESLYVERCGRPSNDVWRRKLAQDSRVHPALFEIEPALDLAEDVVVDGALGAQPQQRLALGVDDRALNLAVLDELLVLAAVRRRIALPLDVLRAVPVGLAQPIEQRTVARPHRVQ